MNTFSNIRQTVTQPSKRTLMIGGIILALIATLIALLFLVPRNQPPKMVHSVAIEYPAQWVEESADDDEKKANIIFKLLHKKEKSAGLTVRAVPFSGTYDINKLPDNVASALQKEIAQFRLVSKTVEQVGPYQAVKIEYTEFDNTKKASASQMILIPTKNQAFYLTYRAKQDVLPKLKDDMNTLNTTLADYFAAQLK